MADERERRYGEVPREHERVVARIRHLVKLADNDAEHEGSLAEYLADQALDIADDLASLIAARKTIAMYKAEGKAALDALDQARSDAARAAEKYVSLERLHQNMYLNIQDAFRVLDRAGIPEYGPTKPDGWAAVHSLEQRVQLLAERAAEVEKWRTEASRLLSRALRAEDKYAALEASWAEFWRKVDAGEIVLEKRRS